MGNSQKKRSEDGTFVHDRLGPVRVTQYEDPQLQAIVSEMEIKKNLESEKVLDNWKIQISRINDSQAKEILLLPLKQEFQKSGMCGSGGVAYITYENMSYVLRGEIDNRLKINRYFEQRELWYLLYNMVRAGNKFERIKKKVGNIHPNNILINDDGQIKIIATCSIPGENDNFEALTEDYEAQAFLAPEQLANDSVSIAQYPFNIDPCLAEVFSIGISILSAATLLPCDDLYSRRKQSIRFNPNILQQLLREVKERYSGFFYDIVYDMTTIDPKTRKHASQIYEMLYQYENEILDLEPFLPPKKYLNSQQNTDRNISQYSAGYESGLMQHNQNPTIRNSSGYIVSSQQQPHQQQQSAYFDHGSQHFNQQQSPMQTLHTQPLNKDSWGGSSSMHNQQSQHQFNNYPNSSGVHHQLYQHSNGQQSGHYIATNSSYPEQQSGVYAGQPQIRAGQTSIMQGSGYRVQSPTNTEQFTNLNSINVAQSNYIPSYQFNPNNSLHGHRP